MSGTKPQQKLSRKEREHQFRLDLVLDAAEEVFADTSYANASVEDIAHSAEISVGTLYNLFHSKEDIYIAVIKRAQDLFFEKLNESLDDARGPRDQVHATVRYPFEHFTRYAKQFRHYAAASNGHQWELQTHVDEQAQGSQHTFTTRLTEICRHGLDQGIFKRGVSAELLAVTVLGIPHSFLLVWLEDETVDLLELVPQALLVADRVIGADAD